MSDDNGEAPPVLHTGTGARRSRRQGSIWRWLRHASAGWPIRSLTGTRHQVAQVDEPRRYPGLKQLASHARDRLRARGAVPSPDPASAERESDSRAELVQVLDQTVYKAEAAGLLNPGWYGVRKLHPDERFARGGPLSARAKAAIADRFQQGTERILRLCREFPSDHGEIRESLNGSQAIRAFHAHLVAATPRAHGVAGLPGYSLVTPFFRHLDYFGECARSVEALFRKVAAGRQSHGMEWVVVNDDPDVTEAELVDRIPLGLASKTIVIPSDNGGSISAALNIGIRRSTYEWLLLLDCDDLIHEDAVEVIGHYAARFPACRYMSSAMVDIDDSGRILRFRQHSEPPWRMLEIGMLAGHLKAIRRDAFRDHGLFDARFDLCQDFEYVLRMMLQEPILIVPEPLYFYRWHRKTQSLSRYSRQMDVHRRVQDEITRRLITSEPLLGSRSNRPERQRRDIP